MHLKKYFSMSFYLKMQYSISIHGFKNLHRCQGSILLDSMPVFQTAFAGRDTHPSNGFLNFIKM